MSLGGRNWENGGNRAGLVVRLKNVLGTNNLHHQKNTIPTVKHDDGSFEGGRNHE